MANALLIPENLMALSQSAIVAASEASASMADDNMLSEAPSKFWRSTQATPGHTWFYGTFAKTRAFTVDVIALVGHNLRRGDQYRAWVSTVSGTPTNQEGYTAYSPTTPTVAQTNTGSGFADVDNGEDSTPLTWATPTAPASGWALQLGFPTPTNAPLAGTDLQVFCIFAKTAADATLNPQPLTCYLCESGTPVLNLGVRYVTSATGQWLFFAWDAALLGAADGSNVEIKFVMDGDATYYVSVGSVVWAEDWLSRTLDTGWITYTPFSGSGITHRPEGGNISSPIVCEFPSSSNAAKRVYVQLRVCRSPDDYAEESEILPTVQDYAQIGTFVVGEAFSTAVNLSYGKLVGSIDNSQIKTTYGGQAFGSKRPTRRVVSLNLGHMTPSEAHTLFDRVVRRRGILRPVIISLLPGDAVQEEATTIFGRLRSPETWIDIQPEQGYENSMSMDFEEVL